MDNLEQLSETQDQSDFILVSSQNESSQQCEGDQMVNMIMNLPALKMPKTKAEGCPKRSLVEIRHLESATNTRSDKKNSKTMETILDTDTDSQCEDEEDQSEQPDCISESEPDDKWNTTIVQQTPADDGDPESPVEPDHTPKDKVKIISKADDDLPDILEKVNSNDSQSNSLSSFQSRNRSNLGSYDQCELYNTQQPHAKGYRFKLFPCSQDDMFAESEGGYVSTPSVHIGSLHMSQEAMLVPETVENYNESPSQDISFPPVIIPCSPTGDEKIISNSPKSTESQNDSNRGSKCQKGIQRNLTGQLFKDSDKVYDVTANETLAVGNQVEESDQDQSVTSTKSDSKSSEKESWNSHRFQEGLLIPTVFDDDFNSEPLHLHLSASNTMRTQTQNTSIVEVIGEESVRNPSQNSQNSNQQVEAFQKKASPRNLSFHSDVITIGSGSTDHHQYDEFHLAIPNGTSEQPQIGAMVETEIPKAKQLTETDMVKADSDIARPERIAEVAVTNMKEHDDATKKVPDASVSELVNDEGNKLTLQMIRSDNESVSEPIFRLERPTVEKYSQLSDEASIDIFSKSAQQRLRKRQYISDSDSDNDIDKIGKQAKEPIEFKKKCTDEKVDSSDEGKEGEAESQTDERRGKQRAVQSGFEEILISQKIVLPEVINPDEFNGTTEPYTHCVSVNKIISNRAMDIECYNKTVTEEVTEQNKNLEINDKKSVNVLTSENTDKGNTVVNVAECFARTEQLIETSMEALENVVITMDVRDLQAVEKVEEYLHSGCHPWSRTSSTSTEHSDLHADMMEKCENNKTPHRMKTPLNKRDSDLKSPKSPKEIQDILKKYSDIILKTQHKQKTKAPNDSISPGLQTSNHRESVVPGHLIPRRLSTQSLPEDLIQTKQLCNQSYVHLKEQIPEEFSIKDRIHLHVSHPGKQLEKHSQSVPTCNPARNNDTVCLNDSYVDSKPQLSTSFNREIDEALSTNVTGTGSVGRETSFSSKKETSFTSSGTVNGRASVQHGMLNKDNSKNIADPKSSGIDNEHLLVQSDMVSLEPQNPASSAKDGSHVLEHVGEKQTHFLRRSLRKPKKKKQLKSLDVRNVHHKSLCVPSPRVTSGTFVSTTQGFVNQDSAWLKPESGHDPYLFHGSQSQIASKEQADLRMEQDIRLGPAIDDMYNNFGKLIAVNKHPVIHKQHGRLLHKKSGLQKLQISTDTSKPVDVQAPHHVPFNTSNTSQGSHVLAMGKTNTSFTMAGSNLSIPSIISQASLGAEVVKSPSGCEMLAVGQEKSARLLGMISTEQFSPNTLQRSDDDQDSVQIVTIVTKTVETLVKRIDTIVEVFGTNGQLLKNSKDMKMVDLYKLQETVKTEYKYMSMSPSRSATSLTSGDLADISSLLSKSSGSTVNFQSIGKDMGNQPGHQMPGTSELGNNCMPVATVVITDQEASGHINSPSTVLPQTVPTSSFPSVTTTNTSGAGNQSMHQTPDTGATGNKSKTATPVVQSDQDASDALTPLGSTINKSGSYLHSRTVSMESPKASESLFSSSSDDERKKREKRPEGTVKIDEQPSKLEDCKVVMETNKTGSSDEVSPMILIQHQEVSLIKPPENEALVRSSGEIGSRVIAKWKDGFYYPGSLKSSADNSKYFVHFDDGDSMLVKVTDILLIEQLPVGQSVMVLTQQGDFEYGLIIKQLPGCYHVETDAGHTGRYTYNQVILSTDQAACIIADRGSSIRIQLSKSSELPHHLGDVSLDNLVDEPRRSAKKKAVTPQAVKSEAEQAGQSQTGGRSRKRKLDMLQPQATSTPTSPKEKSEPVPKQRRVETKSLRNSPVQGGLLSSPGRRSLSKASGGRDVVSKDIGPIPKKKIFRGVCFLMTNADKSDANQETDKKRSHDSSQGTLTDDSTAEEEDLVPFDKDHLKLQIEAGGGMVIQEMDDNLLSSGKKLVLISSTHQRTLKYMQCLACGVPCLSHMWVFDSCTQGQLLNEKSYMLPAGISLERNRLMEWKKKADVFLGLRAVVYSKVKKFVTSWSKVLQFGKCQVHKQLQFTDVDVIFTDDTCSPALVRQARSKSLPLVSTEWIIQSLINSKMVAYDGHPRYKIGVGIST